MWVVLGNMYEVQGLRACTQCFSKRPRERNIKFFLFSNALKSNICIRISIFDCTNFDLPDKIHRAFIKRLRWMKKKHPKKINFTEKRPTNSSFPNGLSSPHFTFFPSIILRNKCGRIAAFCVQITFNRRKRKKNGIKKWKRADGFTLTTFSRWLEKWQMWLFRFEWNHFMRLFVGVIIHWE